MTLPLLFALIYLLLSMRVTVDVRICLNPVRKGLNASLRVWGMAICLDMPLRFKVDGGSAKTQAEKAKQAWPFAKVVMRAICWGQTDVRMRIGLQDAALTALISGVSGALGAVLQAAAGQRFPFEVHAIPDFRTSSFGLYARCIFSFMPGDIMFAVVKEAVKKTQREGLSWLSIPLKA